MVLIGLSFNSFAKNHNVFKLYAYHLKPPFIVDVEKKQGLYFDFARFLNQKSERHQFETVFVPRNRLELMISKGQLNGALIGVSPIWFKDVPETKYLWTKSIFKDRDEVISLKSAPFEFETANSMKGKRLGGVMGFSYFGINKLVNSGEIFRDDTIGEKQVLMMILTGRVDMGIVSRSTFNYLLARNPWQGKFHISTIPHDSYERRVLFPHKYKDVHQYVASLIDNLEQDPLWMSYINNYN